MSESGIKISFSDGLALAGLILAVVLVVLDKAGKLKPGPMLFVLLAVAFIMTMPLALGNPWVSEASSGMIRFTRSVLLICACATIFSSLAVWIAGGSEVSATSPKTESPKQITQEPPKQNAPQSQVVTPSPVEHPSTPKPITREPATPEQIAEALANRIKTQAPVIQRPDYGNLKERTISLANDIMRDLHMHGYPQDRLGGRKYPEPPMVIKQMPTDRDGISEWISSRSGYFFFRFFERTLEIKNELAQFHLRDKRLDDLLERYAALPTKQLTAERRVDYPILPQDIQEVADQLSLLADQIK
jgi:hypothetical protein